MRAALAIVLLAACSGAGSLPELGAREECRAIMNAWRDRARACEYSTEKYDAVIGQCDTAVRLGACDLDRCISVVRALACTEVLTSDAPPGCRCFLRTGGA